ncbi:MAG: type II secretion system protein GspL, partial [Proteobacteria bacterium]|nr:type II secretion system protein GspL [Pseudomonadota bacterium]
MAEIVVIRLARDADPTVEWIVADDNGTRRSAPSSGTLEEAAAEVRGRPVIVLVPAVETLTTTVDLPVRSRARLDAALPYALEEQVADEVDAMHFAAGERRASGVRPVAAVARGTLDAWLARFDEAGIQPWKLIPENHGLARIPGTMSALVERDCVMFNDGADTEFAMQGVTPSDVLVAAGRLTERSDDAPPEQAGHLVVHCGAGDEQRLSHDWIALRHELHSVDVRLLPDGVLPRLAVTVASGQGVNLLQGPYGPKADY